MKREVWPNLVVIPGAGSPAERTLEKRRLKKHGVLNVIRTYQPISRTEISKVSGYNVPTVSSLVDELVRESLVKESEALETGMGRRPIPVTLNDQAAMVIGIHIGRINTIGILMNLGGGAICRLERETRNLKGVASYQAWCNEIISDLYTMAGPNALPLAGAGVGVPGLIQMSGEPIVSAVPNSGDLSNALSSSLKAPVFVDNDARMMALGEKWFGAAKEYETFAVLNLSYGLGLGFVDRGRIFRGALGFGGEISQVVAGEPGVACNSGIVGGIENVVSSFGLKRLCAKKGLGDLGVEVLGARARSGDSAAQEIFDEFADYLAKAIGLVMSMLNPEAVILSGEIAKEADLYMDRVRLQLKNYVLEPVLQNTKIHVSDLRESGGAMGAAASVLQHIYYASHVGVTDVL